MRMDAQATDRLPHKPILDLKHGNIFLIFEFKPLLCPTLHNINPTNLRTDGRTNTQIVP